MGYWAEIWVLFYNNIQFMRFSGPDFGKEWYPYDC